MAKVEKAKTINETFSHHIISKHQHLLNKERIIELFPNVENDDNFNEWQLCLTRFLEDEYQNSLQGEIIESALDFFNQNVESTIEGLLHFKRELSHAIFTLLRPGLSWKNGESLSLDRPEKMVEFESIWHPEYQRYAEHILNHFIQLPLFILGKIKGKNYTSLTLANRAKILEDNQLDYFIQGFDPIVRNAISHGSTNFELFGLNYIDAKGNILLQPIEFGEKFDSLVDTCHSVLVSLLIFLCENKVQIEKIGLKNLPLGLRFIFVDAFCSHSRLDLLSMVESENNKTGMQLNIVCKIKSKSRWTQLYEGLYVCWKISIFGGEDYSRYFISFDCDMPVLTSLVLNGSNLIAAIRSNKILEDCISDIIDTSLLWYDSSNFEKKLYGWKSLFPIYVKSTKREIIKQWRDSGFNVLGSRYKIREKINNSSETIRKIEAHIILNEKGTITETLLHDIVVHAIKQLRKFKVKRTDKNGEKGITRRPDYIGARFYSRQRRNRSLKSYSWKNTELVLIAEWIRPSSKMKPFYTREVNAVIGNIRIKYNPSLIKNQEEK